MAVLVVHDEAGASGTRADQAAPEHPDGRPYRFRMDFDSGAKVLFTDDDADLIEALIPGHNAMDEADQAYHRVRLAQAAAERVQSELLAGVDRSTLREDELRALTAPRGVVQPRADWWTCPVPLVLVDTAYQPFTAVPRPASGLAGGRHEGPNLWWIRPTEVEDFLLSLHDVGFIRILLTEDPAPGQ